MGQQAGKGQGQLGSAQVLLLADHVSPAAGPSRLKSFGDSGYTEVKRMF